MHTSRCKCAVCLAAAGVAVGVYSLDKSGRADEPAGLASFGGLTTSTSITAYSTIAVVGPTVISPITDDEFKGPPVERRAKMEYLEPTTVPAELPPKLAWPVTDTGDAPISKVDTVTEEHRTAEPHAEIRRPRRGTISST